MPKTLSEYVRLLELGEAICKARRIAANANFAGSLTGDSDNEYLDTAQAVEALFLANGWTKPTEN